MALHKVSETAQGDYIREHLYKVARYLAMMAEGLETDNADQIVNGLGGLQWQEQSLIIGVRRMMASAGFSENDVWIKSIMDYQKE